MAMNSKVRCQCGKTISLDEVVWDGGLAYCERCLNIQRSCGPTDPDDDVSVGKRRAALQRYNGEIRNQPASNGTIAIHRRFPTPVNLDDPERSDDTEVVIIDGVDDPEVGSSSRPKFTDDHSNARTATEAQLDQVIIEVIGERFTLDKDMREAARRGEAGPEAQMLEAALTRAEQHIEALRDLAKVLF